MAPKFCVDWRGFLVLLVLSGVLFQSFEARLGKFHLGGRTARTAYETAKAVSPERESHPVVIDANPFLFGTPVEIDFGPVTEPAVPSLVFVAISAPLGARAPPRRG